MIFNVITIFPEALRPYLKTSILGRAQKKKLIKINFLNLRDFAIGKHKKVDDSPFGGGPGMVLKIEPIYKAVSSIKHQASKKSKTRIILFSTRGKKFTNLDAKRLSKYKNLILICGRYEGVDERVADYIADEEISIGEYILAGGELPAMVLIEAISRQIKGVLGKNESLEEVKGSYPVYTKPEVFKATSNKRQETRNKRKAIWKVPKVLLSGNHKKIDEWRKNK